MEEYKINSIIFTKLDHIGDMILATPAIRAVKERFPECRLGILCSSKGKLILKNNPFIDDIFVYNPDMFDRSNENNEFTKVEDFRNVLAVRNKHYDVCISLREDHENAIIQNMLGARYNISFSSGSPYPEIFDYSIPHSWVNNVAYQNFDLLDLIDIVQPYRLQTDIYTTDEDEDWADDYLKKNGVTVFNKIVAVSPGGGWFLNWWPWENYAQLCEQLMEYDKNIKIILIGGNAEKDVIEKIQEKCRYALLDSSGKTTLQQLTALYKRARLVICNDGGTMHVASASRVPILALFGPSPKHFYPIARDKVIIHKEFACSPCPQFQAGMKHKCLNNKCMKAIEVKEVFKTSVKMLNGGY